MKLLALLCACSLAACVDASGGETGRISQPGLTDLAETSGELAENVEVIFRARQDPGVPDADPCVDEGCPDGLSCDWVQGCTAEVTFCCVDEMCGEGRFCDFDAGGLCAPRP